MNKKLNTLLSDLEVFYHKLQSYHWFVKGHPFFQVHAKLEELYDEINEQIDEVAELELMVELKPVSRVYEFLELSNIKETDGDYIDAGSIFKEVINDYKYLLESVESIKALADEENNYLVSAKMDDLIASYRKNIWMISQTQKN